MDRSKVSRLSCFLSPSSKGTLVIRCLALILLAVLVVQPADVFAEKKTVKKAKVTKSSSSSSVAAKKDSSDKNYTSGIFEGYVIYLAPDLTYLSAISRDEKRSRREFYLDKKTVYRVDGLRKTSKDIYLRDKVVIRYFGEDRVAVADEIFVIFGAFEEAQELLKKNKKK